MKAKVLLLFTLASVILLSFTFISNTAKQEDTKVESKITSTDSHGGLVMEDKNQWD